MTLPVGLYEQIISAVVDGDIAEAERSNLAALTRELDAGDSHEYLAAHLADYLGRALRSLPAESRLEKQVDLSNRVIDLLTTSVPDAFGTEDAKVMRAELLL